MVLSRIFAVYLFLFIFSSSLSSKQIWHEAKYDENIKSSSVYEIQKVFTNLAENLNPAVVNIFSTKTINTGGQIPHDLFKFFEHFYGKGLGRSIPNRKATALGSGFIIHEDGYILTNNHVIKNSDEVKVKLFDETEYQAKVLGFDPETDIALIKIDVDRKLKYIPLGDSSKVKAGNLVLAIGNPFGHNHTITYGIVSAKGRVIPEVSVYSDFIQTDASINQGNSGGPLVDIFGNVIGINTAIDPRGQGSIGFSIPIDEAKKILPSLMKGKIVIHETGWLGVGLEKINPSIAKYLGIDENTNGAMVVQVEKDSPADKAGLKNYDVITKFNNKKITSVGDLSFYVKRNKPGEIVKLRIIRDSKKKTVKVKLGSRDSKELMSSSEKANLKTSLGMILKPLTQETIKKYKLNYLKPGEGVIITQIEYGSPASKAGLATEDLIVEVNKRKIKSLSDYYKALKLKDNEHLFRIKRNDRYFFTVVKSK